MRNAHYHGVHITTSARRIKQPSALTVLTTTSVEHAGVSAEKSEDNTMVFPRPDQAIKSVLTKQGLTQTRQMVCHLTDTSQKHRQSSSLGIVAKTQSEAAGVTYHLTVSSGKA